MALWGNNDSANSKPLLPVERQVREVTILTTQGITATGNTIIFQPIGGANSLPGVAVGTYVYSLDANNAVARLPDGSIIDQNDTAYLKSNNTVKSVDAANSKVVLTNNVMAILAANSQVYFANAIAFHSNTQANTYYADTILVTPTRLANNLVNVGNMNIGWNHIQFKTNNDGTKRFLHETLIALANPTASNTSSGNTSSNGIFSGV